MTESVIETHGLRKEFGTKTAVAGLSLSVRPGEVFGFLGPNGAGKTTSLKMLLGLVEPTAGEGTVLGSPIGDRRARAKVGFLPEHFRFHDWLSGRELLHFHGRLYGMKNEDARSRAEELLARVDLLDAAHRPLREYSKGMLQRAGLAQALMNRPALVFLDEPTSGLDPIGRLLVRDIIRDLRAQGTSVFLNSHLLGEVEATCDRVVFVKQGVAIHELELASKTESIAVELTLGDAGPETLLALSRLGNCFEHAQGVVRMQVEHDEVLPELARLVVQRGARLYRMSAARKSLEQWFLEVMGEDQRPG